ncbi:hypothetical protein D9757_002326 [Collybiopsis confluens]|uniref:AAA+ ATPase domain-containing protein n=1 Tax=Collybiopsis confluens TaxID=2823264 RepID=A0A8H5HZX0_9AGAR|nr:hypothetical protein D9757_002326 [Collybiopsis confluens]
MNSSHHPASLFDNDEEIVSGSTPLKIKINMARGSPPINLRRSSRRHNSDVSGGPSGSEYQQSEKSFEEPGDEDEGEDESSAPVMMQTKRGRQVTKQNYVESNDDEDEDAEGEETELQSRNLRRSTRNSSRHNSTEDHNENNEKRRLTRSRANKNLSGFVVEDDEPGTRQRSRFTRTRLLPNHHGRNAAKSRTSRRLRHTKDTTKEDDYKPGSSSPHSADADGSDEDNIHASDDMDLYIEPPPEPEPDDDVSGTDGKPYSLRQRQKINYAIPPPLEDLPLPPPQPKTNRAIGGRGGGGYHGRRKGLGWSASGAELGRWMGLPAADDSDSDVPSRTPRKPYGLGAFEGAVASGGGGLLPGDLAAAGTPSNLGKIGDSTLADADPLGVNVNVTFDEIGGLDEHINSLKEMTVLPLLYPEVFQQFNVTPPRGVLFHGPPGTGKTLLARALAASCRSDGKQITFFMRKGADALSKWVGEAERQLRLLFEEARASQPSIIFFDEIDGLAPVRSSKQDQIHASIVSTLLALMDGMDGRGQVVVIGATNRPDAIDPALRRPGRFDREFYFPLPGLEAREKILGIMTKKWKGWGVWDEDNETETEKAKERLTGLAKLTKGYGGADLRALCTEAALNAIQRKYPQIYKSNDRLLLKPEEISIGLRDFMISIKKLVPSSARSSASAATPLPSQFVPLLAESLEKAKALIGKILPMEKRLTALEEAEFEDYDGEEGALEREMTLQSMEILRIHRPRLILHGLVGMGQSYVGAALLHHLEGYHVQSLELGTLMGDSARTVEAALVQLFVEAKRHSPSVIYIPSLVGWCAAISEMARATVRAMLDTLAPTDPILLLAILDGKFSDLPADVRSWFGPTKDNRIEITFPNTSQRAAFFDALLEDIRRPPNQFADGMKRKKRVLEVLPIAPPLEPRQPSERDLALQLENDQKTITILKYRLGPIMSELKRKFKRFTKRAREEYKEEFHLMAMAAAGTDPQAMTTTSHMAGDHPMDIVQDQYQPQQPLNGHSQPNGVIIPAPANLEPQSEVDVQPALFDIDLEKMHEYLYKDRYLAPDEFLEDVRKIVHNTAMYSYRDPDRHYKAQAMLTATEVSIQDLDPSLKLECERMAKRERKRRTDYKQKKALEREKEKGKERSFEDLPLFNGIRRSARNNGQAPELGITDPVALERRLKRQRDGLGGTSEDESAAEREAKRSKPLEDPSERDPLDITTPVRTPPRPLQGSVRFTEDSIALPNGMQPYQARIDDNPQDGFPLLSNHDGINIGPSNMQLRPQFYNEPPFASGLNSSSYPYPHQLPQTSRLFNQFSPTYSNSHSQLYPSEYLQTHSNNVQPSQSSFSPYPPVPFQSQTQQYPYAQLPFQHQHPPHQEPSLQPHQTADPSNHRDSSHGQAMMPSISFALPSANESEATVLDRPPSAPRNGGVAMLLNPVNATERNERVSSARASPAPQNSSHLPGPIAGNDGNPFLTAPAPQSHRNSVSPQPASILKAPSPIPDIERTPTPLPDFHVNEVLLDQLRASLRENTSKLTIEELEQLRASCLGCVWRQRSEWNRDSLVRELQDVVSDFIAEVGMNGTNDVEFEDP